ncbi:bL21 family ribosomal protein, partial [Enorma sp.]
FKGEKQLVFKFKKRKRYHRLKGHRQQLTKVKITKVQATTRAPRKTTKDAEAAAPAESAE